MYFLLFYYFGVFFAKFKSMVTQYVNDSSMLKNIVSVRVFGLKRSILSFDKDDYEYLIKFYAHFKEKFYMKLSKSS